MAHKCMDCGTLFEGSHDIPDVLNDPFLVVGECPVCNGRLKFTVKCELCEQDFLVEELNSDVCDDCLEDYSENIDLWYKIGQQCNKEVIKINPLFDAIFSIDEIENILLNAAKERGLSCKPFVDVDKSWLAEKLLEEVKK